MAKETILEMQHIVKIYGNGVAANRDVSLTLEKGEIHALLGENGAGKSTLMKILFGMEQPDGGQILLHGQKLSLKSSQDAIAKQIGMVHQHFMLVPSLTVAENIMLGRELGKFGCFTDSKKAVATARALAERYGFDLDVTARVADLPVGVQQKVEILKALYRSAQILILDEPTAVLTPQETGELFIQLQKLRSEGHTIIFISHKLDEIKRICDRATIMRGGRSMGTYLVPDISTDEMSRLMVGREVELHFEKEAAQPGDVMLTVRNLRVRSGQGLYKVDGLSFDLRCGEILGIAGVEGNGQSELVRALTGLAPRYEGEILLGSVDLRGRTVREIRALHLSHIPEDRMTTGCASGLSIRDNLLSIDYALPSYSGRFLLKTEAMDDRADRMIAEYQVACASRGQSVGMLSGGNMQKVVAARELSQRTEVLIVCYPTRGIDVGAAEFIRKRILSYREAGCAILLISADLTELSSLSDRLAVLYKGRFAGVFPDPAHLSEEELGQYMLGLKYDHTKEARTDEQSQAV